MSGRLIYLALLMSVTGHSLGQNITKLSFSKDHLNKRLDGYVLELHTNVSLHQCSKECMLTLGCKSFNSQTSTNTCELNWVNLGDVGTGFLLVNNSWNYFDIDAWPREMVAMCYASMCPSMHRCVTGEPVPYCRPYQKPGYDYFPILNSGTIVYDLPDCVPGLVVKWHIRVGDGFRVLLHIKTMDVANCQESVVYDGMLTELTRFCGIPDLVSSSGTVMLIKIPTESSVFSASYYAGIDQTFVDIPAGVTNNRMVGTMKSPNYPLDYENNIDISWHLAFQSNYNIMFHLVDVNLELHTNCSYDIIRVRASGNVDRSFCEMPTPSFFISSGNTASVYFKTDGSVVRRGFRLDYIAVLP